MRTLAPSRGIASELDPVGRVVLEFEAAWRSGPPPLEPFRDRLGADASYGLAELVLADLRNRYGRGERPAAREYLDRYPELTAEGGRALSLIYEEFCLRAEAGESVDAPEFCRRYPTWRDSLASQLAYHRDLSRAVEPDEPGEPDNFPRLGQRFGEYELVDLLGRGGSARVYLARLAALGGKPFALKVSPDRGGEPAILGKLDHPNIIPVVSSIVEPSSGLRGLCMPYRPGLPLDELIRRLRHGGEPPRRAADFRALIDKAAPGADPAAPGWADFPGGGGFADAVAWLGLKVAQALAHAHARGFFHRDVKPENVLLNGRDGPQLIDFNLAHAPDLAGEARSAHRGGTLPYMAREHLEAFLDPTRWPEVDGRADVFSLGLALRELLTLQSPPRPPDHLPLPRALNALIQAREALPPPIRAANPRVPHALASIVERCLAAAPADRYASADDLAEDLARYLARRPLRVAENRSRAEAALNAARRNRAGLAVAAAMLAVAVPSAALLLESPGRFDIAASPGAVAALEQAARDEAAGRFAEADEVIGNILVSRGDAVAALKEASRRHPDSMALRIGLAHAFEKGRRFAEAEREYRAILDRDPGRVMALAGLGNVTRLAGRHAEAVEHYDRAIARAEAEPPRSVVRDSLPTFYASRGQVLLEQADADFDAGRYAEAAPRFARAAADFARIGPGRRDAPDDPTLAFRRAHFSALSLLGLGRSELASGRAPEAVAALQRALEHAEEASRRRDEDRAIKAKVEAALQRALRQLPSSAPPAP